MTVCRKVFSYTTKDSWDRSNPVEVVMKELNEEMQAQNIISIQEESFVGEFEYDRIEQYPYRDTSKGHRPRTTTLTVFYKQ